jgi:hypothetical protein
MRPVREVFFPEQEARMPHHQLVDRPVAQHVGELHGQLIGVLPSSRRPGRMAGITGPKGVATFATFNRTITRLCGEIW